MSGEFYRFQRACVEAWELGREDLSEWRLDSDHYQMLCDEVQSDGFGLHYLVSPATGKKVPLVVVGSENSLSWLNE